MGRSTFNIPSTSNGKERIRVVTIFSPTKPNNSSAELDFSANVVTSLTTIESNYTSNMASQQYQLIPTDLNQYLVLHDLMTLTKTGVYNTSLKTLFQITIDSITGAINSYALYTANIELNLTNVLLRNRIEDILSGKNEQQAFSGGAGQFSATKTFVLAPIFSYYIVMFGMPAYGVGFDPTKLNIISNILQSNGLDPYGQSSS